jgi:hypothetical protein
MLFRALLHLIFTRFMRMSALYQRFGLGCVFCEAERLSSRHDPRRMRTSSPTQSGLLETAQHFYSKTYAGDYIGFVISLLTLAFCGLPNLIKCLASSSRDVVHRTPAERANGS